MADRHVLEMEPVNDERVTKLFDRAFGPIAFRKEEPMNFDREFARQERQVDALWDKMLKGSNLEKRVKTGVKVAVGWFVFCALLGLGLLGGAVYVIGHFLAKVW